MSGFPIPTLHPNHLSLPLIAPRWGPPRCDPLVPHRPLPPPPLIPPLSSLDRLYVAANRFHIGRAPRAFVFPVAPLQSKNFLKIPGSKIFD